MFCHNMDLVKTLLKLMIQANIIRVRLEAQVLVTGVLCVQFNVVRTFLVSNSHHMVGKPFQLANHIVLEFQFYPCWDALNIILHVLELFPKFSHLI